MITDKTNLNISNKDPLDYLKERYDWTSEDIVNSRLRSHLIPIDELKSGGYDGLSDEEKISKVKADFKRFIEKRAKYVVEAVSSLTNGREINATEIINNVIESSSTDIEENIES